MSMESVCEASNSVLLPAINEEWRKFHPQPTPPYRMRSMSASYNESRVKNFQGSSKSNPNASTTWVHPLPFHERTRFRSYSGSRSRTKSYTERSRSSSSDGLSPTSTIDSHGKLRNLDQLLQQGFIGNTEFRERRLQLVRPTCARTEEEARKAAIAQNNLRLPPIRNRPPPSFEKIKSEHAIKHIFNYKSRKWTTSEIVVKLDEVPFAKGGLRLVYHLQDRTSYKTTQSYRDSIDDEDIDPNLETRPTYVAKLAIDPNEDDETYFRDVEMQAVASEYAKLFNSYHPPRNVEFLNAWIVQLTDRNGLLCGVEPFIAGDYFKHNNNCGYVSDLDRNTPQAFSHFTYEVSNHELIIVDIQGVLDHYTDPQIHTRHGDAFGKGNLAMRGIERFLSTHRCNAICRYLKLPLINPKDIKGTVPQQQFMSQPHVNRLNSSSMSQFKHYYGNSPAYQKRQQQLVQPPETNTPASTDMKQTTTEEDHENGRLDHYHNHIGARRPRGVMPELKLSATDTKQCWCGVPSCCIA